MDLPSFLLYSQPPHLFCFIPCLIQLPPKRVNLIYARKPEPCHVFVPVRLGLATSVIGPQLIPAILYSYFQWRLNYFLVCPWHKLAYEVCVVLCCVRQGKR